ncbi:MAG: NUDIX domain-containing protein [Patescibacteria group bacterium]
MKIGIDYIGVTVTFICHDGEGNYLFNKRSTNCRDEHGAWDPGGGKLELHDTVIGTLKKEIAEEYCTDVLEQEFLGYRDIHREHGGVRTHWVALTFKVQVDRSKVRNGEPHKFDEIEWFTLDNLPQPLHSQFPYFLEQFRDKL